MGYLKFNRIHWLAIIAFAMIVTLPACKKSKISYHKAQPQAVTPTAVTAVTPRPPVTQIQRPTFPRTTPVQPPQTGRRVVNRGNDNEILGDFDRLQDSVDQYLERNKRRKGRIVIDRGGQFEGENDGEFKGESGEKLKRHKKIRRVLIDRTCRCFNCSHEDMNERVREWEPFDESEYRRKETYYSSRCSHRRFKETGACNDDRPDFGPKCPKGGCEYTTVTRRIADPRPWEEEERVFRGKPDNCERIETTADGRSSTKNTQCYRCETKERIRERSSGKLNILFVYAPGSDKDRGGLQARWQAFSKEIAEGTESMFAYLNKKGIPHNVAVLPGITGTKAGRIYPVDADRGHIWSSTDNNHRQMAHELEKAFSSIRRDHPSGNAGLYALTQALKKSNFESLHAHGYFQATSHRKSNTLIVFLSNDSDVCYRFCEANEAEQNASCHENLGKYDKNQLLRLIRKRMPVEPHMIGILRGSKDDETGSVAGFTTHKAGGYVELMDYFGFKNSRSLIPVDFLNSNIAGVGRKQVSTPGRYGVQLVRAIKNIGVRNRYILSRPQGMPEGAKYSYVDTIKLYDNAGTEVACDYDLERGKVVSRKRYFRPDEDAIIRSKYEYCTDKD